MPSFRTRRLRPSPVFFVGLAMGALFIGGLRAHSSMGDDEVEGADQVLPPMVLPEPVQAPAPPREVKPSPGSMRAVAPGTGPAATGTMRGAPPTVAIDSLPRVTFSNMTAIPTVQLESLPVATEPLHSPPSRRKYARYAR